MRYIEAFRNPAAAKVERALIDDLATKLKAAGRTASIMEVCGTHTMAISRFGIRSILPENVELISGPGCPVCVTPPGYIDASIELTRRGCIVVTFGDMLAVPGSSSSLTMCRAEGCVVEPCYSPALALEIAKAQPGKQVVFLAIGFETTIAPVVSIVETAIERHIENVSLLTSFKLVPPALAALMADKEMKIDAFLCPAHVSAIIGADAYRPFAQDAPPGRRGVPCVIAGFEPLDILAGIAGILEQMVGGTACVDNQYSRVVKPKGNPVAQELMAKYLQPVDAAWRGLGEVPASGLGLRPEYAAFDAVQKHGIHVSGGKEPAGCLCGEVIKGKIKPTSCKLFGKGCTPDKPVGPCMVSVEGTCSAYFKYGNIRPA